MVESRPRPFGRMDVEQLRRAGDGKFILHPARQEVVEIVGQKQAARGEIGDRRAGGDNLSKLEAGVIEDVGNAGRGVNALQSRPGVAKVLQAGLGARVPVSVHGKDQPAGVVDERIVDAPGVDAYRGEPGAAGQGAGGLVQAGAHLGPQAGDVPIVVDSE